jgi:hypothetical protein
VANEIKPEQAVAQQRIHDLLGELADLVGPAAWHDDPDEPGPPAGTRMVISEWVIVANWMDIETGDGYLTRFGSHRLQSAHRVGLLHEGLYGFDE